MWKIASSVLKIYLRSGKFLIIHRSLFHRTNIIICTLQQQEKVHLSNQEKLQLLHHHNQNQQILNGHGIATASVSTATVVNETANGGAYFTHGHTHYAPERQHTHAHHLCLMCRQEFAGKAEFMFHVRGHFEGKVSDIAAADVLARSLVDNSGLCTWAQPAPSAFPSDGCGKGVIQDDTIMLKFWDISDDEFSCFVTSDVLR